MMVKIHLPTPEAESRSDDLGVAVYPRENDNAVGDEHHGTAQGGANWYSRWSHKPVSDGSIPSSATSIFSLCTRAGHLSKLPSFPISHFSFLIFTSFKGNAWGYGSGRFPIYRRRFLWYKKRAGRKIPAVLVFVRGLVVFLTDTPFKWLWRLVIVALRRLPGASVPGSFHIWGSSPPAYRQVCVGYVSAIPRVFADMFPILRCNKIPVKRANPAQSAIFAPVITL